MEITPSPDKPDMFDVAVTPTDRHIIAAAFRQWLVAKVMEDEVPNIHRGHIVLGVLDSPQIDVYSIGITKGLLKAMGKVLGWFANESDRIATIAQDRGMQHEFSDTEREKGTLAQGLADQCIEAAYRDELDAFDTLTEDSLPDDFGLGES